MQKNIEFIWNDDAKDAFEEFIDSACREPILQTYNAKAATELYCDASSKGLAAIMMQKGCNEKFNSVYAISQHIKFPHDYEILFLDVVSVFTNIGYGLAILFIKDSWDRFKDSTKLSYSEFINAIQVCLHNSYFKFEGEIYKQNFGTHVNFLISAVIVDIVMNNTESEV